MNCMSVDVCDPVNMSVIQQNIRMFTCVLYLNQSGKHARYVYIYLYLCLCVSVCLWRCSSMSVDFSDLKVRRMTWFLTKMSTPQ